MKKILVMPSSLENLGMVLKSDVDGVILSIEHLAVNSNVYFSLSDIKSIIDLTSKEVCVCINKIMHNEDLELLESTLVSLNKMNVSKILFYDMSVMSIVKRLGIRKELVVFQDHLNASLYSNNFYKNRGVSYSIITNDITIEEVNEIGKSNKLMLIGYGYLPMFYSRRYLVSNYLDYLKREKVGNNYYIKNKDDRYPIVEEEYGTTIYTKEPINLMNEIDRINVDYVILNANFTSDREFKTIMKCFIDGKKDNMEHYTGLMSKKTVYRVEDYE